MGGAELGILVAEDGGGGCWGISLGLLGPIFSLVSSSGTKPLALWMASICSWRVILAWAACWVRAMLPEWPSQVTCKGKQSHSLSGLPELSPMWESEGKEGTRIHLICTFSSGFWISSSPIFLPMAVSSTPKMSVRRSANCFKLLSISRPRYSHIMEIEQKRETKPDALPTRQQLSWCQVEAGPMG